MLRRSSEPRRWRLWLALPTLGIALAMLLTTLVSPTRAYSDDDDVIRVEQDWVLTLNAPDQTVEAPQFHTVMSPISDLNGDYHQVTWNYWDVPDFWGGGLQMQAWHGGELHTYGNFIEQKLSTVAETVSWTQSLCVHDHDGDGDNELRMRVKNGHGTTWGDFGGYHVKVDMDTDVSNLNDYRTATTVANSWVSFGSNRVVSLVITEVRYYGADGVLLHTDTEDRVVFQLEN